MYSFVVSCVSHVCVVDEPALLTVPAIVQDVLGWNMVYYNYIV